MRAAFRLPVLVAALGLAAAQGAPFDPSPPDAETAYWTDEAALLDPAAYELVTGMGWSRTVPAGETWYAVNLYQVDFGPGVKSGFLRTLDARRAIALPAGTTFRALGSQAAVAYVCRPALVSATDARYAADPRGLYFTRLARLRALPLEVLVAKVKTGNPAGSVSSTHFPATTGSAMVVGASVYDASWIGLAVVPPPSTVAYSVNLMDEINNDHAVRFSDTELAPISLTLFTQLNLRSGNQSGEQGGLPINGNGQVLFQRLPADW